MFIWFPQNHLSCSPWGRATVWITSRIKEAAIVFMFFTSADLPLPEEQKQRAQTSGTCTTQPPVLFTQCFPLLGAERKPSPPPAGMPAHLNRRDHDSYSKFCICNCSDRWTLLHLQSQDFLRWVPLKFPSLHIGAWSSGFCLWTIPTHQLSSLNSESDFSCPVLKPLLKHGGTQGKKPHCNRHESNTLSLWL